MIQQVDEGAGVRRGGILKDARSNKPMQRSANRAAHMTSWCRSRPLIAALDIGVRPPPNERTPPRWRGRHCFAGSCRAQTHQVTFVTKQGSAAAGAAAY